MTFYYQLCARCAIARSRVRIPPTAAVYQRQLSVPSLQGRLMSTSGSWRVNGHTTWCTSPVSVVLQLRLVSGWGLMKRRSAPPHGPQGSGKDFTLLCARNICFTFIATPIDTQKNQWPQKRKFAVVKTCSLYTMVSSLCPNWINFHFVDTYTKVNIDYYQYVFHSHWLLLVTLTCEVSGDENL